jgi:hypothetical protein
MIPQIIQDKISEWADSLTERVTQIRIVNVDEIRASISTHIKAALYDCLYEQIPESEKELNKLKTDLLKGCNTEYIKSKIISAKEKLKKENQLFARLRTENQDKELVLWMKEKHNESLLDFYKYFSEKYPNKKNNRYG